MSGNRITTEKNSVTTKKIRPRGMLPRSSSPFRKRQKNDVLVYAKVPAGVDVRAVKAYFKANPQENFIAQHAAISGAPKEAPCNIYRLPDGSILAEYQLIAGAGTFANTHLCVDIDSKVSYAIKEIIGGDSEGYGIDEEMNNFRKQYRDVPEYQSMTQVITVNGSKQGVMPTVPGEKFHKMVKERLEGIDLDGYSEIPVSEPAAAIPEPFQEPKLPQGQKTLAAEAAPAQPPKRSQSVVSITSLYEAEDENISPEEIEERRVELKNKMAQEMEKLARLPVEEFDIGYEKNNPEEAAAIAKKRANNRDVDAIDSIAIYKLSYLQQLKSGTLALATPENRGILRMFGSDLEPVVFEWEPHVEKRKPAVVLDREDAEHFFINFEHLINGAVNMCERGATMSEQGLVDPDLKPENTMFDESRDASNPFDKDAIPLKPQSDFTYEAERTQPLGTAYYLSDYNNKIFKVTMANREKIIRARKLLALYYAIREHAITKLVESLNADNITAFLSNSEVQSEIAAINAYRAGKGAQNISGIEYIVNKLSAYLSAESFGNKDFQEMLSALGLQDSFKTKEDATSFFSVLFDEYGFPKFKSQDFIQKLQKISEKPPYIYSPKTDANSTAIMLELLSSLYFNFAARSVKWAEEKNKKTEHVDVDYLPAEYLSNTNSPLVALFNQYIRITKKMLNPDLLDTYTASEAIKDLYKLRKRVVALKQFQQMLHQSRLSGVVGKLVDAVGLNGAVMSSSAAKDGTREELWSNATASLVVNLDPDRFEVKVSNPNSVVVKTSATKQTFATLQIRENKVDTELSDALPDGELDREAATEILKAHLAVSKPGTIVTIGNCSDRPKDAIMMEAVALELGVTSKFDTDTAEAVARHRVENSAKTSVTAPQI